ncbi:hypothetical protein [Pseudomonas sp. S1(2024)]|uniref:hypothetical protein n=1 Tax=Pseudomonas sp. S1(2024) TaxID=3390191 RepID=UPI0039788D4D
MLQIIIILIAIVLTVLITFGTIHYMGESGDSAAKSQATKYIQEAAQIRGAILIARNDGLYMDTETNLEVLVPKYLATIPQDGANWSTRENEVFKTGVGDNVCVAANKSLGISFVAGDSNVRESADNPGEYIPYCAKDDMNPNTPCCDNSDAGDVEIN